MAKPQNIIAVKGEDCKNNPTYARNVYYCSIRENQTYPQGQKGHVTRQCADCPADISDRHHNAKRCHECAKRARNRINGRYALKWRQERMWLSRVYRKVSYAIETGKLKHPTLHDCVDCGAIAEVYDHRDYNRPLDVEPVCRPCNYQRGKARLPGEAA